MSLYLDTSTLVAALGHELHTDKVQRWLGAQKAGQLHISDWVITEFSSAQAFKLRTGQIELQHRAACLAAFGQLVERSLRVLPVSSAHFRIAARLVDQHELGLRAGDALHLAICGESGMSMVTLDRTLASAAMIRGIPALTADDLAHDR